MRSFAKRLPPLERVETWTGHDAVLALQFENADLLGRHPDEPRAPAERIVASSVGSAEEGIARLRGCIAAWRHQHRSVALRPLGEGEAPIWFYVEGREPGDWLPLAEVGGVAIPYFAPGLVAVASR